MCNNTVIKLELTSILVLPHYNTVKSIAEIQYCTKYASALRLPALSQSVNFISLHTLPILPILRPNENITCPINSRIRKEMHMIKR
jgi:hypothetical protein